MSRSLFISLVAAVVAGSAQAGYKELASSFLSTAASYLPAVTAKNAGIAAAGIATTGVVGYGLNKVYNYRTKPSEQKPEADKPEAGNTQKCVALTEKIKKQNASKGKKAASVEQQPSRLSRMWANRPSMKAVGTVAAVAAVAAVLGGGVYYFRDGISNGLSAVASKAWSMVPSKESVMSIKPMSFFSKNS